MAYVKAFLEKCELLYLTLTLTDDLDIGSQKSLTTRNAHVEYESYITYHSKVIPNLKVVLRQTEKQRDMAKSICPSIYRYRA